MRIYKPSTSTCYISICTLIVQHTIESSIEQFRPSACSQHHKTLSVFEQIYLSSSPVIYRAECRTVVSFRVSQVTCAVFVKPAVGGAGWTIAPGNSAVIQCNIRARHHINGQTAEHETIFITHCESQVRQIDLRILSKYRSCRTNKRVSCDKKERSCIITEK